MGYTVAPTSLLFGFPSAWRDMKIQSDVSLRIDAYLKQQVNCHCNNSCIHAWYLQLYRVKRHSNNEMNHPHVNWSATRWNQTSECSPRQSTSPSPIPKKLKYTRNWSTWRFRLNFAGRDLPASKFFMVLASGIWIHVHEPQWSCSVNSIKEDWFGLR
jgi:hypothetical protein